MSGLFDHSPSTDDEEDIQIAPPPRKPGVELDALFDEEDEGARVSQAQPAPTRQPSSPSVPSQPRTVFSAVVELFEWDEHSKRHAPRGKHGLAVLLTAENTHLLVVYSPDKRPVFKVPFVKATHSKCCVHVQSDSTRWTATFPDLETFMRCRALLHLLYDSHSASTTTVFDHDEGTGPELAVGDSAMFTCRSYRLVDGAVEVSPAESVKKKVAEKGDWLPHTVGMRKGSRRAIFAHPPGLVYLVDLKKARFADPAKSEEESKGVRDSEEKSDKELKCDEPAADKTTVRARMARIGQPMLPIPVPKKEQEEQEQVEEQEQEKQVGQEQAEPSEVEALLSDYPVLHRVVGIEMDRLFLRLECRLERMLDAKLAPLIDKLTSLEGLQARLQVTVEAMDRQNASTK